VIGGDRLFQSAGRPSGMAFIDIAEDDIGPVGRLPHEWLTTIVRVLSYYGAKAIVLDTLLSEPQDTANDHALAEAIRASGRVYIPLSYDISDGEAASLTRRPLPVFAQSVIGAGHINGVQDADGAVRRAPAAISSGGDIVYQLGLKVGFDVLGLGRESVVFSPEKHTIELKMLGDRTVSIPLDEENRIIVNWRALSGGKAVHFPHREILGAVRAHQYGGVSSLDLGLLKDRICIVGMAGSNAMHVKPMPAGSANVPAGVNAMIIDNVLRRDFIRELPKTMNIILIFIVSFIFATALTSLRILRATMVVIVGVTFYLVITMYGLPKNANMVLIFFAVILAAMLLTLFRFLTGFLFMVISALFYLVVSMSLFKLFGLIIVTFYPVLAILLVYTFVYVYSKAMQYFGQIRLVKQATRDGLTGLYNRRHLNLTLETEIKDLHAHKSKKLSLIMCDIDNFKKLNDTYGHQAGDAILIEFARIMRSKCRQVDMVARYGGEEFVVVLLGASGRDAVSVAEKIRIAIEAKHFTFKNEPYHTTLSMGVAEFRGEATPAELIEKTDQALYRAKQSGKNRVVFNE